MRFHWLMWLIVWVLALVATPATAYAHEGQEGFHPERLWALLRMALLVAAIISGAIGALWYYERRKSRQKTSN